MKIAIILIQLLITAGVFWYLSHKLDFGAVYESIRGISPIGLSSAIFLFALQIIAVSYRLRFALRVVGGDCAFLTAVRSVLAGAFVGQTPLSNFGGDMVRVWIIFSGGTKLRTAASAVTLDRIFGFLSLVVLILLTLPALWIHVGDPALRLGIVIVLSLVAAGVLIFLTLQRIPSIVRQRFRFADWAGQVSREFHLLLLAKKNSAFILGIGVATHLVSLAIIYILGQEVGMGVSYFQVMYLAPFPLLVSLLPVSIGGWGVREGAMIAAFGLVGVPSGKTLSASILFGILSLAVALPGGLIWLHAQFKPTKAH